MDTKLKTNEVKKAKNEVINKGFILSLLVIIMVSYSLDLYMRRIVNNRTNNYEYFNSREFINTTGNFRSQIKVYTNGLEYGIGEEYNNIIDEYNFNLDLTDKENAYKRVDKDLEDELKQIDTRYDKNISDINNEKKNQIKYIASNYSIDPSVDLEFEIQTEQYMNSDIANEVKNVIEDFNDRLVSSNNSRENEKDEANKRAKEKKDKIKYTTLSSSRNFGDANLGFDYKLVSDNGKAELYNNKDIETFKNKIIYLEIHFGNSIDDFNVIETVPSDTVSPQIYDNLITKIKNHMGNDIKNTTLKFAITSANLQKESYLAYDMFAYNMLNNPTYMIFIAIALLIIFIGSLVVPYEGKSKIVKFFCKTYIEFKVALITMCTLISALLIANGATSELKLFPVFLIWITLIILVGRNVRYIMNKGIVEGVLKNLLFVVILYKMVSFIFKPFKIRRRKDNKKEKEVLENKNYKRISKSKSKLVKAIDNFKNTSTKKLKNEKITKKIVIYSVVASVYIGTNLFLIFLGIISHAMLLILIGTLMIVITPVVFWFITKKFFIQLEEIEEASKSIVKGDFNIDLKERNSRELNVISENLSNINTGFKAAIQGEIKSEKMKAELITNVSHDLKTPLTSIINYVDLLQKDNLTESQKAEYLLILENKSKRLKVLIEDLFEATKASSGNIALNIEKVDVVAILRQTIGEFKEKIESSGLSFKINIPKEKIILDLDGARTWRIFENLIGNTLKYSMKNSRVYIDLKKVNGKVMFEIKNMSAYELNCDPSELRERFKRGDSSRHTEGSGLGLSIANSLVELQGGELSIDIDGDLFKVSIVF